MQLTNTQKVIALQELLEMLAAHPEGLQTGDLLRTKSFRNRRELTAKQVEQLLDSANGVQKQRVQLMASLEPEPVPIGTRSFGSTTLWKLEKANG
jgi:hypothetical protein